MLVVGRFVAEPGENLKCPGDSAGRFLNSGYTLLVGDKSGLWVVEETILV